jgi:hypothetical protein
MLNYKNKMGNGKSKTLSNLTAEEVTNVYANSILQQGQNCGAMPANINDINIIGNFNDVDITQYINSNEQTQCVFAGTSQQAIQNQLIAELTAKAQSSAQQSSDISLLGGLFSLAGGNLLNETNLDVQSIANAVANITTSQVQNCATGSCYPTIAGKLDANGDPCTAATCPASPNSTACSGMCYSSGGPCDTSCTQNNTNVVCVQGNFNDVTANQTLDVTWAQNCVYAPTVTSQVSQSLQNEINAIASAATTTGLTILGYILWFCVLLVVVGGLFLLGRYFYRQYYSKPKQ